MGMVHYYPGLNRPAAPTCSVCIANYNGAEILADCIESVLEQRGEISVEIIVHDDASTDSSLTSLRHRYPTVDWLASDSNVGFCIANNRMVSAARGEFVLLLNNDAALHPDALQTLLATVRIQPSQGILTLPQYDWLTGELVDRGCLLDPFYNPVPNLEPCRHDVAYVIGACLFIQRSVWEELGGFPEWMESMAEDMYLCCLARLRGFSVGVTNSSGYRHRQGATFGGNRVDGGRLRTTYRRRFLSERNKTAVMIVCTPGAFAWVLLALHLMALVFEGAMLSLFYRDMRLWREIYAPTLAQVLTRWREWRIKRHIAQRARQIKLASYLKTFTWLPRKLVLLRRHGMPSVR